VADREKLVELAELVDALTEPSREVNCEVHRALFGAKSWREAGLKGGDGNWVYNDPDRPNVGILAPLDFTGRWEDAERALPGPEWPEFQITRRFGTGYHANVGTGDDGVGCETAAIALTAAALRARAAEQEGR
jgi:hypothetical protein